MHMLMAVINDSSKVVHILDEFVRIGVRGSTVIESIGMARMTTENVPLFSRFAELGGSERHNKTIFAVIEGDELVDEAINVISGIVGDLSLPDTAVVFILPVERSVGIRKVEESVSE